MTVSQHPLSELIKSGGLTSNYDNIFSQLDLALLEETPARNLIAEPLARNQIAVHPDVRDDLLTFCGPHPFYLQIAGFYLCDAMTNGAFTTERVKEDFTWEAERHWQGLWQALSPEEQLAFPVAWVVTATPTAQTYCRILERKGLLLAENNGYKPFSEGFAQWVQKQVLPPASEIVPPAEPKPVAEEEEPEKSESQTNQSTQLDWKILLVATFVTLLVLVVAAWVLKTMIGDQSTGNLILLLVIALPFILVLVGKLTGQDLLAWFGQLLGRSKEE